MRSSRLTAGFLLSLTVGVAATRGDVLHNEAISGDISTDGASPTAYTVSEGTQSVIGTLRTSSAVDNRDWLALTVPAGLQISALTQISYVSGDTTSFAGLR